MATLPLLKTGAVMQYPATRERSYSTGIVRFVDGAEQRYRDYKAPLTRWVVRLDLLDEREMAAIQDFFVEQDGGYESFTFVDPWDESVHPNCSLDGDVLEAWFLDELRCRTEVVVRENR